MPVKSEQLGRWLDADAIVYVAILPFNWAALISIWRITARVKYFNVLGKSALLGRSVSGDRSQSSA